MLTLLNVQTRSRTAIGQSVTTRIKLTLSTIVIAKDLNHNIFRCSSATFMNIAVNTISVYFAKPTTCFITDGMWTSKKLKWNKISWFLHTKCDRINWTVFHTDTFRPLCSKYVFKTLWQKYNCFQLYSIIIMIVLSIIESVLIFEYR